MGNVVNSGVRWEVGIFGKFRYNFVSYWVGFWRNEEWMDALFGSSKLDSTLPKV